MLSSTSSQTGTQLYMAPELLAGMPASARSDIYSLGVVLYQLLAEDLRQPVTADWHKAIQDSLLRADLEQCLAGSPEERLVKRGLARLKKDIPIDCRVLDIACGIGTSIEYTLDTVAVKYPAII